MSVQLAKVTCHGTYKVIYDDTKAEPYRVVYQYKEYTGNRLVSHQKLEFTSNHFSVSLNYILRKVQMWDEIEEIRIRGNKDVY